MEYTFFNKKDSRGLLNNLFSINIQTIPFQSIIIPTGFPAIAYIYGDKQTIIYNNKTTNIKGLTLLGQYDATYNFSVNFKGHNIGANLHPTALYKIFGIDIASLTNKHPQLELINKKIFDQFNPIFLKYENDVSVLIEKIINLIDTLDLHIDKDVNRIDIAIDYILEKEGMLQVADLLKIVSLSQKSLEVKFKKIIGLTPGKYIRLIRFIKLMRKYENKKIAINDLIYMYNYYDHSHFIKDFKLFMSESPKEYFKKEYPLIKAYSKNL